MNASAEKYTCCFLQNIIKSEQYRVSSRHDEWAVIICCVCVMKCTSSGGNFRGCEQNLCYRVPPLTGHKCNGTNMATESGARYRDYQSVFRVTDVKKRKKLLGKVLKIPEFNEEDDWRLGILLDIH